jgi:hypothetical protein
LLLVYVRALSPVNVPMTVSIICSHVRVTDIVVIERLSLTGHHRESAPVPLPVILLYMPIHVTVMAVTVSECHSCVNALTKAVTNTFVQLTVTGFSGLLHTLSLLS